MTYSYKKLSANKLETIRELQSAKIENSRTGDVSMTKIGLYLNEVTRAQSHD
jgi:hypothetical protein